MKIFLWNIINSKIIIVFMDNAGLIMDADAIIKIN